MDLGSDQRLQHLVQLLVKGSKEISLEFHSGLIPEPWYVPDNLTSGARVLGSVYTVTVLTTLVLDW